MPVLKASPCQAPRRKSPARQAQGPAAICADVISALATLAALAREQHGPEILEAVTTSLAGKPIEVLALHGVVAALRGTAHNMALPLEVIKFSEARALDVDALEDHLEAELPDAHATWLTLTVVGPQAVKVGIGWYEDANDNSGELVMPVFREGTFPTNNPVLAFMACAGLVDDPMYLGYDQTLN